MDLSSTVQDTSDPQSQNTDQPRSQSNRTTQKQVRFSDDDDDSDDDDNVRRLGLYQHYPDRHDATATSDAAVDIIALHGLRARSPKTWIAWKKDGDPTSGDVFWLKDKKMLPKVIPDSRILTYDWNADYVGDPAHDLFLGHADTLLRRLDTDREHTHRLHRPIIFIASCFSGLLLAKALVRASETFHPSYERTHLILSKTVGIAFLGTPFRGSWTVGHSTAVSRVDLAKQANLDFNSELIQYLRNNSRDDSGAGPSPLDEVVQKFSELLRSNQSLKAVCFYETLPTYVAAIQRDLPSQHLPTRHNARELTVSRSSACLDGLLSIPLEVRHNMLHKHNSPNGPAYKEIAAILRRFAKTARETVLEQEPFANQYFPARTRMMQQDQNPANYEDELLKELQYQIEQKCGEPKSGNSNKTDTERLFFETFLIQIISSENLREGATVLLSGEMKIRFEQKRLAFCTLLDSIANKDIQDSNQATEPSNRYFRGSGKYPDLERMLKIVSLSDGPLEIATGTHFSLFRLESDATASRARAECMDFRDFLWTMHGPPSLLRASLHAKAVRNSSTHRVLEKFEVDYRRRTGRVLDMIGEEFALCSAPEPHTDHKVMMQLYDVETWEEKILDGGVDFRLSCPKLSHQSSIWHNALCTFQERVGYIHPLGGGLCNMLDRASRRYDGLILVMRDHETTREACCSVKSLRRHDRMPKVYVRLSHVVNVLEAFGPRSPQAQQHYKLNYTERRKLAVKLALALLVSCSWNHSTCPWDDDEVQFLGSSASNYDNEEVYVTCYVGSDAWANMKGSVGECAPIPAFTKFAKLLLEMEYGSYPSGDFSEDNDYGYKIVKDRYQTQREDDDPSKDSYLDAVEACLEFDRLYMEERTKAVARKETEEQTSRRLIRTMIVAKIMGDLNGSKKRKWQEIGADE